MTLTHGRNAPMETLDYPLAGRAAPPPLRPILTTKLPPPVTDPPGHLPALDGLRGLAILLVMGHHFVFGISPSGPVERSVVSVLGAGWIGVDLFFVLSGFLITGILYDSREQGHYYRNFYWRRILRIFPLYYAVLLGATFLAPSVMQHFSAAPDQSMSQELPWAWIYGANFRMAWTGRLSLGYLAHFWSLAVEEHFYLVWPLLVGTLSRRWLMRVCGFLILGAFLMRVGLAGTHGHWMAVMWLTPCRIDALALGGFIALAARGPGTIAVLVEPATVAAALGGAILVGFFLGGGGFDPENDRILQTLGLTALAVVFGALLIYAICRPARSIFGKALRAPILRTLGKYSYGLYVLHFPVLVLVLFRLQLPRRLLPILHLPLLADLAQVATGLAVSFALAFLSYQCLEAPFLRLKRRFA